MRFKTSGISSKGGRAANQDHSGKAQQENLRCWVVADGLGGHQGGAVASRLAVEHILAAFKEQPALSEQALRHYIEVSNTAIIASQQTDFSLSFMRTTVVVLVSDDQYAMWGHLGDSRLYHFRQGHIQAQTRDHSVPQAMASAGEISEAEIRHHEERSALLRSLGHTEKRLMPTITQPQRVQEGDAFLLCTDGFWEYVLETEMETDLATSHSPAQWLEHMERRLLACAKSNHDNYTATGIYAMPAMW